MSHDSTNASPMDARSQPAEPWLTRERFNRQLWQAVLPPLLLLAAHAAMITLLFLYFMQASNLARQTDLVIGSITEVERLLVSMETGMRGYLLTEDETLLEPYVKSRPRFEPALQHLAKLVSDNPAQQARLDGFRDQYLQWLDSERSLLPDPVDQPLTPAAIDAVKSRNKMSGRMRDMLREMSLTERSLHLTRDARKQRAAAIALGGGIATSLLLAAALAFINRLTVLRLSDTYQRVIDDAAANGKQFIDLAESVPQLIWISDGEGKPIYFNKPLAEFTGLKRDGPDLPNWWTQLNQDDLPAAQSQWTESMKTGRPFEGEYRLRRGADGSYRWFLCRAIPVSGADGKRSRWFGSCTDIEQQKQLQRDRESLLAAERAARSDLLQHNRTKDEFLATLSHELRTPLTAILGWTRLVQDPKVRNQHLDRAIEAIESGAKSLSRLIDDLLDMSRINTGKLLLSVERTDLRPIVRAAVDAASPAAANKQISLIVDTDRPEPVNINGDPARLQQIVWNLLSNAVKFTPSGGSISIRLEADAQAARIVVTDTGHGIDPSFLPFVFQRFRQADGSTTRKHGGLGLGLSIVQHLAELHGGVASAASAGPGLGSTFTVELPRAGKTIGAPAQPVPEVPHDSLAGKRLLVVDDDVNTIGMLRVLLENAGGQVTAALNASDAFDKVRGQMFDAMISDLGMPDTDGYTLMRRLRSWEAQESREPIRAVALSAFARPEDKAAAISAGFHTYVTKPASPDELLRALHSVLTTQPTGSDSPVSGESRPSGH